MTFPLLGLLIGIVAAIPPLGPVTLVVVRRALAGDYRGAHAVGFGRVLPETLYCAAATFGVTVLLDAFPAARLALEWLGALILLGIGAWFIVADVSPSETPADGGSARAGAFATGFALSAFNPSLLLSWSAIVAIIVSMTGLEPSIAAKALFAPAVGLGIALGYVALLSVLRRVDSRLAPTAVARGVRLLGAAVALIGLSQAVRLLMQ